MRFAGRMPALWNMDADDSAPVLLLARQRETDDKLYFRWCILDAFGMEKSFDEFKKELSKPVGKSAKRIIKEVSEDYDKAFLNGFEKVEI